MPGDPRQYLYQDNRLLMYFNIVKFGINLLVTILLAPLSLSSTFCKLFESLIIPAASLNNNQFGFHKGCGKSFGISQRCNDLHINLVWVTLGQYVHGIYM